MNQPVEPVLLHFDSDKLYIIDDLIAMPDGTLGRVIAWERRGAGFRITLELC